MLPGPIKYEWALISLYTTTIQYLAQDDVCQEDSLSLVNHMESPEEQLGPFCSRGGEKAGTLKELWFPSSSLSDQSVPDRASYGPFLGPSLCIVNKE